MFIVHFLIDSVISLAVWYVAGKFGDPVVRRVLGLVPSSPENRRFRQAAVYGFLMTALVALVYYVLPVANYGVLDFVGVWLLTGGVEYATTRGLNVNK